MADQSKYFDPEAIFREQLGYIRLNKLKTYAKADIDLSVARVDAEYDIPGNNLTVVQLDAAVSIKFNEKDNASLDLADHHEILDAPFYRFFITNSAGSAGTLCRLRIGRASLFRAVPNPSVSVSTTVGLKSVAGTQINPSTEDTLAKIVPIAKASVFNTALPAAEADLLAADISPTNSPSYMRVYICVSVSGVLRVERVQSTVEVTENLNGGVALSAGAAYMFDVPWRSGDTVNLVYSVTSGTIYNLDICEIGACA